MVITLISLIFAFVMTTYLELSHINLDYSYLAILMIIGGAGVLLIAPLIHTLMLIPLQNLQQQLTPGLIGLFRNDRPLQINQILLFLFPLLSFLLAAAIWFIPLKAFYKIILFAEWIVAFGLALDLMRDGLKRWTRFLNPFYLIDLFSHQGKIAIQNENDDLLWSSLDSLAEISLKGIETSKIALTTQSMNTFPPLAHTFFSSSKSISRLTQDKQIEEKTGQDEASYTIFYLLQRLQSIFDKALKHHLEIICNHMIVVLGKIIVYAAQCDLSLVSLPTQFLGKFALKGQKEGMKEISNMATGTLLEISKTILTDLDLTYAELEDPFQAIIHNLDLIAKATFQEDKSFNIKLLTQPFRDLRALFSTEKMANHRDTPVILQMIDQVLGEFAMLEQVMRTIPPLPNIDLSKPI